MDIINALRGVFLAILLGWVPTTVANDTRQPIIAGDLEVFYGVMPAAVLLTHPADHAERGMHGGVPGTRNTYHLVVSVFDAKGRTRIENAQVRARVSELGLTPQEKLLEPMRMAGVVTYGNYFTMTDPGPYRITLNIVRPGGKSVQASFEHRHR